eukprot:599541_1
MALLTLFLGDKHQTTHTCFGNCSIGQFGEDECGECLAPSDANWNQCMGCDKRPNSGYELNPCGRCIARTMDAFSTFGMDCLGTCDGDAAWMNAACVWRHLLWIGMNALGAMV